MAIAVWALSLSAPAQNFDESKVAPYQLPDPLTCTDGTKVTTSRQWEKKRRPEVMEMFQSLMYGRTPKEKVKAEYTLMKEDTHWLGGKATVQQVKMHFTGNGSTHDAMLLIVRPNAVKKTPVIFCYNFQGNAQTMGYDSSILPHASSSFYDQIWVNHDGCGVWDYERAVDRGYAIATMCYHDIHPDDPEYRGQSVAKLFAGYEEGEQMRSDAWSAIGMWAWGASRVADYLEKQPWADKRHLAVMGHSRLGKTALWAGAQDTRFGVVISNESGCGGATLTRRNFGETLEIITGAFPHWFCPGFRNFVGKEHQMPFDQHELLALVAPRALYVASAEQDQWCDPKGEFLSAYHAGEVYHLYGYQGLDTTEQPGLHQPIMHRVGYHIRAGIHDVTCYDWSRYLDFCDRHFAP